MWKRSVCTACLLSIPAHNFHIYFSHLLQHIYSSLCVCVQVPSGRVARGLPGEEHQQPRDQLLSAERPHHLDSVPDPGGCLHGSRPGCLQPFCHWVHSAGRSVKMQKHIFISHLLLCKQIYQDIYKHHSLQAHIVLNVLNKFPRHVLSLLLQPLHLKISCSWRPSTFWCNWEESHICCK